MLRWRAGLLIALAISPAAFAQQVIRGGWDQAMRLHAGQRAEVRTRAGEKISGPIAVVTADAIGIQKKDRVISTPTADVRRIRVRSLKRRFRNAGIIAAAGAGAGAALGAVANRATYNDRFQIISTRDVMIAFSAAVGVVAFGIGMIPPARRTVYEVR